ncbi:hypothetical protein NC652_015886 [Populus alba x Populus x berolinensis]|nr:hypothetical protein NC652_015886 [Populus alba x Populus x berolinensis]
MATQGFFGCDLFSCFYGQDLSHGLPIQEALIIFLLAWSQWSNLLVNLDPFFCINFFNWLLISFFLFCKEKFSF